ncbi:MAG: hypothetical protein COY09_01985 [Candidatus Portnoybacteria bacterium CG_4_10_14_0_2_um_filter_39_11]|uniref:Type II secretion system protein GspF domain-containing protein n=1 Tax=Candidatus Portnoybacteria bacterium CG_4_10_14_0_2_um_filter_39_11 TaxID=1974797 RepID=A0A2M7UHW9_9BACT|nr:MAG: hypothetical protein AUJ33_00985 [Parcubacteria group bacterium CG1_02_40_25]PIZ70822.1 MAG: hypothetical protein COY09_01985 [Candidatus Portnoybacteria bacterium CG_4_10_14_0_2_um_filter_39_11]
MTTKKTHVNSRSLFARLSHLDKLLFAKNLSIMVRAGLPLKQAVGLLENQSSSGTMRKISHNLSRDLDNGLSLAQGLKKYRRIFGNLFISLIAIGEESGSLDQSLDHLAKQLEESYELKKKVQAAMVYPIIILSISVLLGAGVIFFILPKLIPLFENLKITLPWSTRLIIWLANVTKNYFYILLSAFLFVIIGLPIISRIKIIKNINHIIWLKLPLIKQLIQQINMANFCRILSVLLKGGIPLAQAMEITGQSTDNLVYQHHLNKTAIFVQEGKNISDYFTIYPQIFSTNTTQLIRAAENSGKLEEILMYLAEFYDKESGRRLENLSNLIGPILLLAIGLVVTILALGIVTPIYQMSQGIVK